MIGDLAAIEGVPGIAPAAKQMGALTAKNIAREIRGHQRLPFHYRDYGQLAPIGRNSAVAMFYFLINFRNRIAVMLDWAWSYWTYDRYARIVISNKAVT